MRKKSHDKNLQRAGIIVHHVGPVSKEIDEIYIRYEIFNVGHDPIMAEPWIILTNKKIKKRFFDALDQITDLVDKDVWEMQLGHDAEMERRVKLLMKEAQSEK